MHPRCGDRPLVLSPSVRTTNMILSAVWNHNGDRTKGLSPQRRCSDSVTVVVPHSCSGGVQAWKSSLTPIISKPTQFCQPFTLAYPLLTTTLNPLATAGDS